MTLNEIKTAISNGRRVFHHNPGYEVKQDDNGKYLIICAENNYTIGLTWMDGTTMNGKPADFYSTHGE